MLFKLRTIPNAIGAVVRNIRCALRGEDPIMVPPAVRIERERRCEACPHFHAPTRQCGVCTCFVGLKSLFSAEECPADPPRWRAARWFSDGLKQNKRPLAG